MTGVDLPTLFRSSDACVKSLSTGDAPPKPASRRAVLCAAMSASASPEERYSSVFARLAAASRSCLWPLKRRKPKGLVFLGFGLFEGEEGEEVEGVSAAVAVVVVDVDSVSPNASLFFSFVCFRVLFNSKSAFLRGGISHRSLPLSKDQGKRRSATRRK